MNAIGGLKYQVDQTHLRSLARSQEALDPRPAGPDFSQRLTDGLKSVTSAQSEASALARAFEAGTEQNLAKVMVAQQVSSLGFQLTLNVRNKALSAYKDIMNMPV
jgi:flagellar hook-basal body complex protein FliE